MKTWAHDLPSTDTCRVVHIPRGLPAPRRERRLKENMIIWWLLFRVLSRKVIVFSECRVILETAIFIPFSEPNRKYRKVLHDFEIPTPLTICLYPSPPKKKSTKCHYCHVSHLYHSPHITITLTTENPPKKYFIVRGFESRSGWIHERDCSFT